MENKEQFSKNIKLTGHGLTVPMVFAVAQDLEHSITLSIEEKSLKKMERSRAFVFDIVEKGEPVYGINTGFGALASKHISKNDLETLQVNLIRSHCTGVGNPFHDTITRAIMLLRANCLCSGHSGINPDLVKLLLSFINKGITPVVPEKGSVGASGDLAPLSHIALSLIGEGKVSYKGNIVETKIALQKENLKPVKLGPKDGLALINGTAVMAALGCLALHRGYQLIKLADVCAAITNEAARGTSSAYDPLITSLKPHPGQLDCVDNLNRLVQDSEIRSSHIDCDKVQDPYSLRCVPQVHGACRQTLKHAQVVLDIEINSVTDNPLIFVDEKKVVSGGNFHGEAPAMCMDYLAMGLAELCNISERRVEKMMNPVFSNLPHFLTPDSGLNSGLMIAHVTSAALTSENKVLCHPASVDSVPTSTDKEDHVSMGVTSGRKLIEVMQNLKHCLAIELLCNTQAIDLLSPLKTSPLVQSVLDLIRTKVPKITEDRVFHDDIMAIVELIENQSILNTVESQIGELK